MKIRITEKGWAGFTGQFGAFDFVDGVSVEDVGRGDAANLAGLIGIENVETGENPSASQRIIDKYQDSAPVEAVRVESTEFASAADITVRTKEELEAVADKLGIKGLREITDPLGLKGNSINELIQKILTDQADKLKAAEVKETN